MCPRSIVAFVACLGMATPGWTDEPPAPAQVPTPPAVSSPPPAAVRLVPFVPLQAAPRAIEEPGALLPALAREARRDARILLATGRHQAAHAAWRRAADASPGRAAIPAEAARRYAAARLHRVAFEWAREARRLEPARKDLVLLEARIAWTLGRADLALASVLDAAEGGDSAELWAFAAALRAESGDHEEAGEAYERALELDPTPSAWWLGRAIAAERSLRHDDARSAYRGALQRDLDEESRRFALERLNTLLERNLP